MDLVKYLGSDCRQVMEIALRALASQRFGGCGSSSITSTATAEHEYEEGVALPILTLSSLGVHPKRIACPRVPCVSAANALTDQAGKC